jgi:hypothetical protein
MTTNALPGPDLDNPQQSFVDPHGLIEPKELTRAMKGLALDRWELDAHLRGDTRLLDQIGRARELLAEQVGVNGQHWPRTRMAGRRKPLS